MIPRERDQVAVQAGQLFLVVAVEVEAEGVGGGDRWWSEVRSSPALTLLRRVAHRRFEGFDPLVDQSECEKAGEHCAVQRLV